MDWETQMSDLLYVGNLPKSATERDLQEKFGRSGTVNSAVIVTDAKSGRSRRFGLVEMSSLAEAKAAIGLLNMTQFDDTVISVSFSKSHQHR
jgi:RNA recognition motif-containing protein